MRIKKTKEIKNYQKKIANKKRISIKKKYIYIKNRFQLYKHQYKAKKTYIYRGKKIFCASYVFCAIPLKGGVMFCVRV